MRSALRASRAAVSWAGKVVGAALGAVAGGPIGALVGAALGHQFDRGLTEAGRRPSAAVQESFFTTTFAVMGHVAKADGRVTEDEIRSARAIMHHMRLAPGQVQEAIRLFTEGKQANFPLDETVERFRRVSGRRRDLHRAFVEIQVQAILFAGPIHAATRDVLWRVARSLGVTRVELAQIEALIRLQQARAGRRTGTGTRTRIAEAYRVLGVAPDAGEKEVKTAYRRLMNQHHPDKLRSRGMPDSMIPVAEEKTREIRAAYDAIRASRDMR